MAQKVIASIQDVYDAFRASAVAAGFAVVDVANGSKLQVDFSGDTSYLNTDNTLFIEFTNNAGRMIYRVCLQPKAAVVWDYNKGLTNLKYSSLLSTLSTQNSNEWRDMGAIGDTVSYATVPNFMCISPHKTSVSGDLFMVWKSTSPYDGVTRHYVSYGAAYYNSNQYYQPKFSQISPNIQACWTTAAAYRTIAGDGVTTPCVVWQTVNGMAIDYLPYWVCWRTDLSLYANNFSMDGKNYHYHGKWLTDQNYNSFGSAGGFELAFRMDA